MNAIIDVIANEASVPADRRSGIMKRKTRRRRQYCPVRSPQGNTNQVPVEKENDKLNKGRNHLFSLPFGFVS